MEEEKKEVELTAEEKFNLVLSVGEECVTAADLKNLVAKKPNFILYDGFEPSGRMHIAQGVFKAMNVNKCTKAGGIFVFWVADWFALMNDKQGGDLEKIQTVGKYLIEVWKAVGMDMTRVKFLWSSDEINSRADEYWSRALDIARHNSIHRITKCCTIMGRKEGGLTAAQILYPIMQCTDVFFLKADICQLGVDQRKVNMLAREYCESAGIKLKPVILSHHMLYGLLKGQVKMSKSNPMSAIFMEDSKEDVELKINQAHCPLTVEEGAVDMGIEEEISLVEDKLKNPCLDYVRHIIFCLPSATFEVVSEATGETTVYKSAKEVEEAFFGGVIKELELKRALIIAINKLVEPVREHFANNEFARDLLKTIRSFTNDAPTATFVRRLTLPKRDAATNSNAEVKEEPKWLVFAPNANPSLKLHTFLGLVSQLESCPPDHEPILLLPDYTSFVLNSCKGDRKVIAACFTVLVSTLKSLKPELMNRVRVLLQSEWVLSNPNDFWISVINVGRKFSLDRIRLVNEALPTAGHVVSSLIHVACVLASGATKIVCIGDEGGLVNFHKLALEYYPMLDKEAVEGSQLVIPEIVQLPEIPDLKLRAVTENFDDPEIDLLLLDSQVETNVKVKKAFCEPTNLTFNPLLVLVGQLELHRGFSIVRKPENGGNVDYNALDDIRAAFADATLHPADFKHAVTKRLNEFLDQARNTSWKNDAAVKKAIADIKNSLKTKK